MADAAAADARFARLVAGSSRAVSGRGDGETLPLLHGMPLAFKDLTDVAGVVTTHGSAALDHKPAPVGRRPRLRNSRQPASSPWARPRFRNSG